MMRWGNGPYLRSFYSGHFIIGFTLTPLERLIFSLSSLFFSCVVLSWFRSRGIHVPLPVKRKEPDHSLRSGSIQ